MSLFLRGDDFPRGSSTSGEMKDGGSQRGTAKGEREDGEMAVKR